MTNTEALALRKRLRLTQQDFWGRIGVTQSGGSRYESGRAIPKPTQTLLALTYGPKKQAERVYRRLRG